jgi:hypothetical protein
MKMSSLPFRRAAALALLLGMGVLVQEPAFAQLAPSEYDLKAAFIYQFLSYISWPETKAGTDDVLLIGVVGAPELADNLSMLAGNQSDDARAIEVRKLLPEGDARALHILFVDVEATAQARVLLQSAVSNGVVTITEQLPRPADSIINFEVIGGKVRFDIALGLARQHGVDVSGRLLQVALRVIDSP